MKIIFGTLGLALLAVAYYLFTEGDVQWREWGFVHYTLGIGAVCLVYAILPFPKRFKYTACCSASIYRDLEREGFTSPYLTCPIKGDANFGYMMKNPKEYKALVIDANYSEENVFSINDITEAIKLHMSKVPVIVRLDQSTYGSTDISWMLLALSSNQLIVLNTPQLTALLTKYYGWKR
jgi:hypothetical protein